MENQQYVKLLAYKYVYIQYYNISVFDNNLNFIYYVKKKEPSLKCRPTRPQKLPIFLKLESKQYMDAFIKVTAFSGKQFQKRFLKNEFFYIFDPIVTQSYSQGSNMIELESTLPENTFIQFLCNFSGQSVSERKILSFLCIFP